MKNVKWTLKSNWLEPMFESRLSGKSMVIYKDIDGYSCQVSEVLVYDTIESLVFDVMNVVNNGVIVHE